MCLLSVIPVKWMQCDLTDVCTEKRLRKSSLHHDQGIDWTGREGKQLRSIMLKFMRFVECCVPWLCLLPDVLENMGM